MQEAIRFFKTTIARSRSSHGKGRFITNIACGYGPDGRAGDQLHMTDSRNGTVLRAKMPVRGRTLVSHL